MDLIPCLDAFVAAADEASFSAGARQGAGKPAGTLKVALAPSVGRHYIVPLLGDFVDRYPDVVPDLCFENRQVDPVAEGFVARKLAKVRSVLVAAPAYLARRGAPAGLADLGRHPALLPHALPLFDAGELVRVLPDWHADTRPLAIYYSSRKLVPAKVRVFVDHVVERFRAGGQAARFGRG